MAPLQRQKVNVVRGVDHGGHAEYRVRHRDAPPQFGIVLDVVDQQRGVVQVGDDAFDLVQSGLLRDVEPELEAVDELAADVLARDGVYVVVGLDESLIEVVLCFVSLRLPLRRGRGGFLLLPLLTGHG